MNVENWILYYERYILSELYKIIENLYYIYLYADKIDCYSYVNNFLIIIWIIVTMTVTDYANCLI